MIPTADQIEQYREHGYYVTDPIISPTDLDAIIAEVETRLAKADAEIAARQAGKDKDTESLDLPGQRYFLNALHETSPDCLRLVTAAPLVEMAMALVGPDVRLYFNGAVVKPPRKGATFAWHQDAAYDPIEPMDFLTCWLALDDATIENGCIWVIPGSHTWGLLKHERDPQINDKVGYTGPEEGVAVPVKRGQIVNFHSLMLHRSGANTTDHGRRAWVFNYCPLASINPELGKMIGDLVPVAVNNRVLTPQGAPFPQGVSRRA